MSAILDYDLFSVTRLRQEDNLTKNKKYLTSYYRIGSYQIAMNKKEKK